MHTPHAFPRRHLGADDAQTTRLANDCGFASVTELIDTAVPKGIRLDRALDLPAALDEPAALA